ncbi:Protein zds1 [Termitomyces sp. J132]|nr:hypothetical protein H2248_010786 [Termitomyces sp. 'cryptogamus']KNZ74660.1 Protein zds1 [Termitomyces sp. J132]
MPAGLQPSEYDIQREVEALRDIRRRSVTPGALTIDLDLPNQSSPTSPTSYRLSPSDESSSESASGSGTSSSEGPPQTPPNQANDTFPLFQSLWVPASVHPEIAPAEFRAFLKEHARLSPSLEDGSGPLGRSGSFSSLVSSSGLGRKKSMLSRQYRPDEHDGVENENIVPLRRNRSSFYHNQGPQLTFDDLQKLEKLAEEASVSDDPSRLRVVLRRSLSMNVPPSALGNMDEMPDMDEADVPIIVPPPGQILRRAARTKIRKAGSSGDGGGHRFGGSRRKPTRAQTVFVEPRSSDDISSSDHGDSVELGPGERRSMHEGSAQRPESFSEETSIFDAYAREDSDDSHTPVIISSSPPPAEIDLLEEPQPQPISEIQPELLEALGPVIHQPQPQRLLSPQPSAEKQLSRTPSPSEPPSPASSAERPSLSQSPPAVTLSPPPYLPTTSSPPPVRKEKDKKGLFGKWGADKGAKKGKQRDSENRERASEKEKDSGFFGSLFGSKKKQEEVPPPLLSPGQSGRETAQALLGAPKSKTPVSSGLSSGIGPNNYSRYPIHVERAIYRLSHIKLANPRRPLYEQVLISNLMFWYLGVINKTQNPQSTPNVQAQTAQPPTSSAETHHTDDTEAERERREREQQELRERAERERQEKERLERDMEMKKKESGRKGSLTKAPPPGVGRRAEMPVRGPQYEMQHREMQQEYNGYNGQFQQGGLPILRSTSAPALNTNGQPQYSQQNNPPQLMQPQATHPGDIFYYTADNIPQQSRLPPGAMSPEQQMWYNQQSQVQRQPSPSLPSPPVRPRSPPARNNGRYNPNSSQEHTALDNGTEHRMPVRSISDTAVPSQPMTNGKMRKVASAHAVVSSDWQDPDVGVNGEEEDMPLAMWQQHRRR